jgi:hypothetical protein
MLANFDSNQSLPINPKKKEIKLYAAGVEHLGLRLGRSKLTMGRKSRSRSDKINAALKGPLSKEQKKELLQKRRAYQIYKRQITKVQSSVT